jgi:RNA polymerase sigma-70 factor (ECF subfamily)
VVSDAPATQPSLLIRLRDPGDAPAWSQFVDVYGPLIFGFGRRRGLQDADAADLTQEVLARVSQAVRKLEYDPGRGSFRGWLYTVTRNCFLAFVQRKRRHEHAAAGADLALADLPAPDDEDAWRDEYRRRLFSWAAAQVEAEVSAEAWQAFWQTGVLGRAAQDVATELGMTLAAVYMAKSRTLARIRRHIQLAEGEGDASEGAAGAGAQGGDHTEVIHG